MADYEGKYSGVNIDAMLGKIKDMIGATASLDGEGGMVPKPVIGDEVKFLRGDGSWQIPLSGSYDDLSDKPDLTLIGITNGGLINQDYQVALVGMALENGYVLTQEYYDMISQACPITGNIYNYSLNPSFSVEFGNGNIIMAKVDDVIIVVITAIFTNHETSDLQSMRAHLTISSDLSFVREYANTAIFPDSDNKKITIGGGLVGAASKDISVELQLGGDGSKALMDDGTYKDVCQLDCVKAIKDDIHELKMLNSSDYYVAGWVDGDLDPNAVEFHGDREFANDWNFYLLDTTINAGETTTPVGKLMRGNLLRFENGDYAPTVGITEEMRSQCDVALYTDISASSLAYAAGSYNAAAEWLIDKQLIQSGSSPRSLYTAEGQAVSHKLRPWETTETKYSIGVGRGNTIYVLDNTVGDSGKLWSGLFSKPIIWDGIDVSKYPLRPTAYTPCPVVTIDNKSRCFFYAYDAGDANCVSHSGVNNTCQMFVNGRTYPRVVDMNQINDMTWSRANNANPNSSYPFAEGGFHALNAYIISQEIYYGRKDIHNVNMFGSGISSNDPCNSESTWKSNGGVRYKLSSSSTWKYLRWNESGDIKEADSSNYTFMSYVVNMEYPKEQCMEGQMAASYANEIGATEGIDFDFYGAYYSYVNVPQTSGLDGMNVKVMKVMRDTFNAKDSSDQSVSWDLEAMLRMSLFGGVSLSGDIFVYSGGGYEQVGELVNDPSVNKAGNPFKLYMECDQTRWMTVVDVNKADRDVFDFEFSYPFMGDFDNKSNGYVKKRAPYTGWKVENGGGIISGQCCYGWSDCYWGSTIGTRTRVSARFRGNAANSACSARYLHATHAVSNAARTVAGSAQALLEEEGAAVPAG